MRRPMIFVTAFVVVVALLAAPPNSEPARATASEAAGQAGAKNVILFVGDGMGMSTITAARILEGQLAGNKGEGNSLSFESFTNIGLARTYNEDFQVPDSAGTMTAMMTGEKTDRGLVNVAKAGKRGDCTTLAGNELTSWMIEAENLGLATGVVTTARLTHATPAATYAVSIERNYEADVDVPPGCGQADIASQLIDFPHGDGLEVALGGGRRNFTPASMADVEDGSEFGARADGRNLAAEWAARPNAEYVWNKADFDAIDSAQTQHLLGLFERSHMRYELERDGDVGGEPSLSEMTEKAIEMLSQDPDGFALVVESARIDHAHHATQARKALTETIEFSNAIAKAIEMVNLNQTLIIVTADHGHAMTIDGYPSRGNDILGLVDGWTGSDDLPYTTINYTTGGAQYLNPDGTRVDLSTLDTTAVNFKQPSSVPTSGSRHSGEDVPIYAQGPRSRFLRGAHGQGKVGRVISTALDLFHGP